MDTASVIIDLTVSSLGGYNKCLNIKHAKSQCRPSSLLISSLENVSPGIRPRFLSQNMEANDPEKKIPSTAAKAISLSP
ncbi:putative F ORF B [Vaccinia virus Copenhagen]|uniref:Uncharacterized 8.3 kDa protein n=1 Tax=Vaccinia virus (strain Copenhagen) TaxID=10249 RepID=YVFB_VACCC|nr:RecName: Full=Uncharacterized 8.3 kDa protein [Vaccinia virus Copenhagen]AAA48019.1 putative F ORF B [Vaccinia virus Copenhagen]WDR17165.1 putative F ORF B [Vaccinia virus Copenhagen]